MVWFKWTVFLLAFPAAGLYLLALKKPSFRKLVLFTISFLAALASLTAWNQPALVTEEHQAVMRWCSAIGNGSRDSAGRFMARNFICVNTVFDQQLVPNPNAIAGDSTHLTITDRGKLLTLLRYCNAHPELIDGLVIDLAFTEGSPADNALAAELKKWSGAHSLLMAVSASSVNNALFRFGEQTEGNVSEKVSEDQVLSHGLFQNGRPSLPLRIYLSLHPGEQAAQWRGTGLAMLTHKGNFSGLLLNRFLPALPVDDERLLQVMTEHEAYFDLGYLTSTDGASHLAQVMKQRKNSGGLNMLFIGAFEGTRDDAHRTAFGSAHGSAIILNLAFNLERGYADLTIALFLVLWAAFLFLLDYLIFKRKPVRAVFIHRKKDAGQHKDGEKPKLKQSYGMRLWMHVWKFFIIEELHFWILLIVFSLCYFLLNHFINLISLTIVVICFDSGLKFFAGKGKT